MHKLLRTSLLAFAASLGIAALAQNHIVTIHGTLSPCDPAMVGDSVLVQSTPGTEPQQTLVAYITNNCSFGVDAVVTSLTGGFRAFASCSNGAWVTDSAYYSLTPPQPGIVEINLSCGGQQMDCLGVPGGAALPGSACTTFLGQPGTWSVDCVCLADPSACNACFTVGQTGADPNGSGGTPWSISTSNCSTGPTPITYSWALPNGSTSTEAAPTFIFSSPGVYGICLTVASNGCTSTHCDTVVVDSMGFISNTPVWYDCQGLLWGPNTPGTPCDDGDSTTTGDTWTVGCYCEGQGGGTTDCLGVLNGNAMPGTSCTVPGTAIPGYWSNDCVCVPDSGSINCHACISIHQTAPFTALFTSCSTDTTSGTTHLWDFSDAGAQSGINTVHVYPGPGTYTVCLNVTDPITGFCSTCDSVVVDASGNISPLAPLTCQANFWPIQAYDSTATGVQPIPNEVWVWNLSSGGNGTYQFLWEFGDGSSSTDAFPTHTYDGPGPWLLCLTMVSGDTLSGGCTDIHCDSVSVDENGILNGMAVQGGGHTAHQNPNRATGFVLNVIHQVPTGIAEQRAFTHLRAWPNPVADLLNLSFHNSANGTVAVTVIDPSGRVVISESRNLMNGDNTVTVPTNTLEQGLYMVRIGNGAESVTQRFLKVR